MNETLGRTFMLIGNLMRTFLNEEQQEFVDSLDAEKWYPVEKQIELIKYVEANAGIDKVKACGKGIYYTLKDVMEQTGIKTPLQALESIVPAYLQYNRGESIGQWKIIKAEAGSAIIEDNSIYDCALGEGVVLGAAMAFGGLNAQVKHVKCKKKGDISCINEITWR